MRTPYPKTNSIVPNYVAALRFIRIFESTSLEKWSECSASFATGGEEVEGIYHVMSCLTLVLHYRHSHHIGLESL